MSYGTRYEWARDLPALLQRDATVCSSFEILELCLRKKFLLHKRGNIILRLEGVKSSPRVFAKLGIDQAETQMCGLLLSSAANRTLTNDRINKKNDEYRKNKNDHQLSWKHEPSLVLEKINILIVSTAVFGIHAVAHNESIFDCSTNIIWLQRQLSASGLIQ